MELWNFETAGTWYELVEHTKGQCVTDNHGLQRSIDKSLECLSSSAKLYILQKNGLIVTAIVGDISRGLVENDEYMFERINEYHISSSADELAVKYAIKFLEKKCR